MSRYDNHIYVLEDRGIVKVGRSYDAKERFKSHKTSNPLVKFIKSYEAPVWGEKYIHQKLSKHLVQGCVEWFHFYDGIYEDIDKLIENVVKQEEKYGEDFKKTRAKNNANSKTISVYKFKDVSREDYAFIAAYNFDNAFKALKRISPVHVKCCETRGIDAIPAHPDNLKEYIYMSTLRTYDERDFCFHRKINFDKTYGITTKREEMFMSKNNEPLINTLFKFKTKGRLPNHYY